MALDRWRVGGIAFTCLAPGLRRGAEHRGRYCRLSPGRSRLRPQGWDIAPVLGALGQHDRLSQTTGDGRPVVAVHTDIRRIIQWATDQTQMLALDCRGETEPAVVVG